MLRTLALRVALIAAAALMMVAFAPGATLASAPSATVAFHNQAPLQPDGSVLVTVDYRCLPNFFGSIGFLFVEVEQPGAFGFTSIGATCDDRKHTVALDVPGAFTPGTASVRADLSSGSATATTQAKLHVK